MAKSERYRLSIIVPIYKVEAYLRKCVDSLITQDLSPSEYEIILVDDGSPDECPVIADSYAQRFSHVKVIHRTNGGLSAARNSGLLMATGRYIQFVDSDDYLEPCVLKGLVEKMEKDKLDVLRFNYHNVNEDHEVFEPNKVSKPFVDYKDEICNGLTFLTERLGFACYVVQFMIKRSLLENCMFKEGVLYEDVEWTPRVLNIANRVTSTNQYVYNYLIRSGSITQSKETEKKRKALGDKFRLIDSLQSQMKNVDDTRWYKGFLAQLTISMIADISKYFFEERKRMLSLIKKKHLFPLSSYHSTKIVRRKICIANISPLLLCWLFHVKNA